MMKATLMILIVGVNAVALSMLGYQLGTKDAREFYQGFLVGQQSVWNDNAARSGEVYGKTYIDLYSKPKIIGAYSKTSASQYSVKRKRRK